MAWLKNSTSPSIVALLLAFWIPSAQADIYQWVDEKGGVHYSEHPPRSGPYKRVKIGVKQPGNVESSKERLNRLLEQQKAAEETRQQRKDGAQARIKNAKIRQQNCETAKKNLAVLETKPRTVLQHSDGTVTRLTEEERQAKIAETREKVKEFCD